MRRFQTKRLVRHSPDDMFRLVADVERYPEFVPLCHRLKVRSRETGPDGRDILLADMTVAYKMLRETFTSRVVLDRQASEIVVSYVDGPFKSLENRWHFVPAGEGGCEIRFFIAYAFRSKIFERVAGAVFDRTFSSFAEAFERRADHIYGRKPPRARQAAL